METGKGNNQLIEIGKMILTALLAYLQYAAGGFLLIAILNAKAGVTGLDLLQAQTPEVSLKMQFLLILFLINKPLAIFWIGQKWQAGQITLWVLYLIFLCADIAGIWVYQKLVLGTVSIPAILVLAFFSAIIVATSLHRNRQKSSSREV